MSSRSSWAVSPDAITEVIPRIPASSPRNTAPIPILQPMALALPEPVPLAAIPFRPWRIIWCALSWGHFWWPGAVRCLDCGWERRRA
ncbi:hypothetical protein [Streptosporangium sp. NPDC002721]|uniref:hypothetical protein n=1 Tax=Streptosporangium sp. NPDC002721 TaxID=3366188 RepID=UPI0036AC723F